MTIRNLSRVALIAWPLFASGVASAFAAELADTPKLLFQQARDLANAGDAESAISVLDELRAEYPHDVDYAFLRAQLFARQGRDAEALDELRDAMRLAPDYEDVRLLYESLQARQHEISDDAPQWSILAGAAHQRLDSGLPSWNEQFVELSREQKNSRTYRIGVAREDRFEQADIAVSFGGDLHFASDWIAGVALAVTGDADFRPDLEYSGNIARSLARGWVLGMRYRRREYESTAVGSFTSTVEKYQGRFRSAYAIGATRLPGARTLFNHALTVNWYYSDRSSIGLSVNTGKEAEAIGPGQVLETDVRGVSLSGRRQLNDRFGLQWWLGLHDQGDYYRRNFLGLAVSIKL